jgi:predicted glycogen debranching enzyme
MKLPQISYEREALSHFDGMVGKEWLVTNGLGGYSSSTVLGVNTRKYHGLLVAAVHPPKDRRVFLTKLDEDLIIGNSISRLGANEFQNGFFPQGYSFLEEFSVSPFPRFVYSVKGVQVTKTVFMPYGKNAAVADYAIKSRGESDVDFKVFPIVNWRPFHQTTERSRVSGGFRQESGEREAKLVFSSPESALLLKSTSGSYVVQGKWVEHVYLREEADRGESCFDDCFQPGFFEFNVKAGEEKSFAIVAVADEGLIGASNVLGQLPSSLHGLRSLFDSEVKRCESLVTDFYIARRSIRVSDWLSWLILTADSFVVRGKSEEERLVIAGYHWFESWGRDTFVSLPGLLLVTGRFEDARRVFLSYAHYCKSGLIPNFIPDRGEQVSYNTVDATLWYVNAVFQYLKYTGDFDFVHDHLWDTLKEILDKHVHGTSFGIHVDSDGLLLHGPQLTWVDSSVEGKPVNPRAGKAVEIQALWHNGLKILALLAEKFGEKDRAESIAAMADRAKRSFLEKFWNAERNCLYDVIGQDGNDASLRPNQIVTCALDFMTLDREKAEKVVEVVERELLTPFGLRTLARSDPRYVGVYAGVRRSRDRAYHNGTVWPWLLGPFTTAFLRVKDCTELARGNVLKNFLMPFFMKQVFESGLGTLSEIFDGDSPHKPRGCVAQAWSIAEPLRAFVEDAMRVRPRHVL